MPNGSGRRRGICRYAGKMDDDEAKTVLSGMTISLIGMIIGAVVVIIACAGLGYWCLSGLLW